MVSRNLHSAAKEFGDMVEEMDYMGVFTGSAALGVGLMGGEIIGTEARDRLSGRRPAVREAGDIGARVGTGAALVKLANTLDLRDNPTVESALFLAGFASTSSGVLRLIENVLDFLSEQFTTTSNSTRSSSRSRSRSRSRATQKVNVSSSSGSSSNVRSDRVRDASQTAQALLS